MFNETNTICRKRFKEALCLLMGAALLWPLPAIEKRAPPLSIEFETAALQAPVLASAPILTSPTIHARRSRAAKDYIAWTQLQYPELRIKAAKTLYERRSNLLPADAVQMVRAIRTNGITDDETLGWLAMTVAQRTWHGITEKERQDYLLAVSAIDFGVGHGSRWQAVFIRPIYSAVSAEESTLKKPYRLRKKWSKRTATNKLPKLSYMRIAAKRAQEKHPHAIITEHELLAELGITHEQFYAYVFAEEVMPAWLSVRPRMVTEALVDAVLPVLWSRPQEALCMDDVGIALRMGPNLFYHWARDHYPDNVFVTLADRFCIYRRANMPTEDSRGKRREKIIPFVINGVWKYFEEEGVGIHAPEEMTHTPTARERRVVRKLINDLAKQTTGSRVHKLSIDALASHHVAVGAYEISLMPIVDRVVEMNGKGMSKMTLLLRRYGFVKEGPSSVEDITSLAAFKKLYASGAIKNVPWKKLSLTLKQQLVLALAEQQKKQDHLYWLESDDYNIPLRSICNAQGEPLVLTGLFQSVAAEGRRNKSRQFAPFYVLERLQMIEAPIPYTHPYETLKNKTDLTQALKNKWIQNIMWERVPKPIVQDLILELAFRRGKSLERLTTADFMEDRGRLPSLPLWDSGRRTHIDISLEWVYKRALRDPDRGERTPIEHLLRTWWPEGVPQWISLSDLAAESGIGEGILTRNMHRGLIAPFGPSDCPDIRTIAVHRQEADRIIQLTRSMQERFGIARRGVLTVKTGRKSSTLVWDIPRTIEILERTRRPEVREDLFTQMMWAMGDLSTPSLEDALENYFLESVERPTGHLRRDLNLLEPLLTRCPAALKRLQESNALRLAVKNEILPQFTAQVQEALPETSSIIKRCFDRQSRSFLHFMVQQMSAGLVFTERAGVSHENFLDIGALVFHPGHLEQGLGYVLQRVGKRLTISFGPDQHQQYDASAPLTVAVQAAQLAEACASLDLLRNPPPATVPLHRSA